MVSDIYQTPIPTKAHIPINSQYGYSNGSSTNTSNVNTPTKEREPVPALEDLVNLCFEKKIGISIGESRSYYVKRFEEFVRRLHCDENLRFLVDIYKYDFYYNRLFKANEEGERLNKTSSSNLDYALKNDIPLRIPVSKPRKASSVISVRSEDHDPAAFLVSTIDDLDGETIESSGIQAWSNLREQAMQSDSDEDDLEEETNEVNVSSSTGSSENIKKMLTYQWNFIIENYIVSDAPEQVNLSNQLYDEILEKDRTEGIHNPLVLWKAKNEVFLLMKENVYLRFVNQEKSASEISLSTEGRTSPLCVPTRVENHNGTPCSIVLPPCPSPTESVTKVSKSMKKSRFLHLASPSQTPNLSSSSHSLTSFSNFFGHLKLNQTSPNSYPNSTSTSPLHLDERPPSTRFSKFWKPRRSNNSTPFSPTADDFKGSGD